MTVDDEALGGRLPLVDPTALDQAQQRFYDAAMAEQYPWSVDAGFRFVTADQRLIGPYNAFLRRPDIAEKFQDFARAESRHTSLSPQLREVVILAVGSVHGAGYEVYAHRVLARAAGISEDDADALATGRPPGQLGPEAELLFALVTQLAVDHHVEQTVYDRALTTFGEQGLVDIASLMGVYLFVCTALNLFAVPAPE